MSRSQSNSAPSMQFAIYSAQTGDTFGEIWATDENAALDTYAVRRGYPDRDALWDANGGALQYLSARAIHS
jgi:hypothetical protein